ncbi:hypothetical protein GCM10010222_65600 [Streptomyces tanashiensis]|nr:hypothetical protein GCM10010222_65600 [Streptomyces tanashiensis]
MGTGDMKRVHARAVRQAGVRLVGVAPLGAARSCSPFPAGHRNGFDAFAAGTDAAKRGEHRDGRLPFAHGGRAAAMSPRTGCS